MPREFNPGHFYFCVMETTARLYSIFKEHPQVFTDTRKIIPGGVFFALKGEHFNGNAFAATAIQQGAACAVIDEAAFKKDDRFLLVPDVLTALQDLARHHRQQLHIPFIAITGSNGKTTSKELISVVLASRYKVSHTLGNLNNHIGVPLTLLSVSAADEMAVIEMGANHQQEIALLCSIAEPDYGLITNIGKAHLEGFGGLEGVKKGKGELFDFLKSRDHVIFVNPDQTALIELLDNYEHFKSYGRDHGYDISGTAEDNNGLLTVKWKKKHDDAVHTIKTALTGDYNLANVLAAACVGIHFGVSPELICRAVESYIPGNQRSQVLRRGTNTIILDAYNANPTSMEAALRNFNAHYKGEKMVVIGDMLELGDESDREHAAIAALIDQMNFREVVLVGNNFGASAAKLRCHYFKNADEATDWMSREKISNMSVLIKGSRGLKMEKTLEAL